jgi:hypothetical protein
MIKKFNEFIKEEYNFEDGNYEYEGYAVKDINTNTNIVQTDLVTVIVNDEDAEHEFEVSNMGDMMFIKPIYLEDGEFSNYVRENLNEYGSLETGELSEFLSVDTDECIGEELEIDGFNIEIIDFNHHGGLEEGSVTFYMGEDEISVEFTENAQNKFQFENIHWTFNGESVEQIHDFDMEHFFDFVHDLYQKNSGVKFLIGE